MEDFHRKDLGLRSDPEHAVVVAARRRRELARMEVFPRKSLALGAPPAPAVLAAAPPPPPGAAGAVNFVPGQDVKRRTKALRRRIKMGGSALSDEKAAPKAAPR